MDLLIRLVLGTVVVVVAGLFVGVMVWHNLRVWRARRAYRNLPEEVKDQVLRWIEEAARDRPSVTLLRLDDERACEGNEILLQSHVGGVPYMERGEEWPDVSPGTFLLQVRLDEPTLGATWQGRLLTVFLKHDLEQVVRSYAAPSPERAIIPTAPVAPLRCVPLTPLRMPAEKDDGLFPAPPARLCELVPAIPQALRRFTRDPAGLLTQILRPGLYGYDLQTPDMAYEGGDPMLIQNPHDPVCEDCGKPMRFLFQFGEIIPGVQLADGGVCYVFRGC